MKILYEDSSIIVCIKPAGIPSEGEGSNALPRIISLQLGEKNYENTDIFPVHRLDKETEGVMVLARTKAAAAALCKSIQEHKLCKIYLACVDGIPDMDEALLEDFLYFDRRACKSFVTSRERKGVKRASLEYKILASRDNISLLRIQLHTGRTHQIRVQLSSRGLPLVGDRRYGASRSECSHIALLAYSLSFPHPKTKEILTFKAESPKRAPWSNFTDIKLTD